MSETHVRRAVIEHLARLSPTEYVHPRTLAKDLQLAPETLNAYLATGKADGEIEARKGGSVKLTSRLYIQLHKSATNAAVPAPVERRIANNPWISGPFYLLCAVTLLVIFRVIFGTLSPWFIPVVVAGGILMLSVIGALQLRNDELLKEESFLKLMFKALEYLPLLRTLLPHRKNDATKVDKDNTIEGNENDGKKG